MSFKDHQWRAIQDLVEKLIASRGEYFSIGVVTKRDPKRKLVWTDEFGNTPIPLFTFNFQLKYYDTQQDGTLKVRKSKVPRGTVKELDVLVPNVGDTVLIARHLGSRSLPKCIGVMQSHNFDPQGDD
jgi:hypothetical protein